MQNEAVGTRQEQFSERGFLHLSGIFTHEDTMQWRHECIRLQELEIINPTNNRAHYKNPQLPYPESIEPVVDISPLFKQLADDERVTEILQEILRDTPLLLKSRLIYHLPNDTYSALHQDWVFGIQELSTADDIVSVSFQIDESNSNNGSIELYEQHHQPLGLPNEERPLTDAEKKMLNPAHQQLIETVAGDLLVLHPLTPHRNGKNRTTIPRRTLYLMYNAARCGNLREQYYETYLKGFQHQHGSTFI